MVERRGWSSRQHFLAAGGLFILPAALLTGLCAWAHVAFGALLGYIPTATA